ncbi:MAG: nucleoside kinase [Chloroflexi bacterium]|nr:nucleoside kinase [Chloroflexota bacterium]
MPSLVRPAKPRRTAHITFDDGRVFSAPVGTRLEEYVKAATKDDGQPPAIAAILDGKLTELGREVWRDGWVKVVRMGEPDGMRIYRRSLKFMLVAVAAQHFPEATVYVEHSITHGGYFCEVRGRPSFSVQELDELEQHMREVVEADLPIERTQTSLEEAIEWFRGSGDLEKVALLEQRRKPTLILYRLLDTRDYFHGFMAPSTGYLRYFALEPADGGFLLRFPKQNRPTEIAPLGPRSPIFDVFREYSKWLEALGIGYVANLNAAIKTGRLDEIILVTEALHEQRIGEIAEEIAARRDRVRIALVAGPSASGKTTFARRLAVHLLALGLRPLAISIDDYFLDREHTPRDEHGDYDFESLYAVDLPHLNRQLNQLIAGEEVQLPRFDFHDGKRLPGPTVRIGPNHILILEGIHGLNPDLLPDVDPARCFRIYVSALTQLNLDRYNRISTTDTRLLRRIVRDAHFRGYSAAETISRWQSVRRGERKWIFPHQNRADVMFNSALTYEISMLKPLAMPLLLQIEPGTVERIEAARLLALLQWFRSAETTHIPSDSILREFIGGSILEDYRPWPFAPNE